MKSQQTQYKKKIALSSNNKKSPADKLFTIAYALTFIMKLKKSRKGTKHRLNVLKQWITTQKSYLHNLQLATKFIKTPLVNSKLINRDESVILCSQFQAMIKLSQIMLQTVKSSIYGPQINDKSVIRIGRSQIKSTLSPHKILLGQKLKIIAQGYRLYGSYFGNRSSSQNLLHRLNKTHPDKMISIQQNLQQQAKKQDQRKQNITIKDCIEQPLYRLFKYVLLIQSYMKKLPKQHPDYQALAITKQIFKNINKSCNDLMTKLQAQQKKIKLQQLLGIRIQGVVKYMMEMAADTIQFPVKCYIFNTFVLLSYIQSLSAKQKKFMTVQLNEFSQIFNQRDLKYFKNVLYLIGSQNSVHLFFSQPGAKTQFKNTVDQIIKTIKYSQDRKRKLGTFKKNQAKFKFTLDNNQSRNNSQLKNYFRIQVLTPELRPLGNINSQNTYISRFMLPFFYEDWQKIIKPQIIKNNKRQTISANNRITYNQVKKGDMDFEQYLQMPKKLLMIGQTIDFHFKELQKLESDIKNAFKNDRIQLPQLDPITKDTNFYSRGRKKTKRYEVRNYFIQEYLNALFRHPIIIKNPLHLIKFLRIQPELWDYCSQRVDQTLKSNQQGTNYDFTHCRNCKHANIASIDKFQQIRGYLAKKYNFTPQNIPRQKYCMNFYHLLRLKLLFFNPIVFNNLERVLLYTFYAEGKLDYPFIYRSSQNAKQIRIFLPGVQQQFIRIIIYENTTAGQIIEHISQKYHISSMFDFSLAINYYERERIIGWNEYIMDIVKLFDIKYIQSSQVMQKQSGFFSSISNWSKSLFNSQQTRIRLKKTVFLSKQLQKKSLFANKQKGGLIMQQIFQEIYKTSILLFVEELAQVTGLYYCLKQVQQISHFQKNKLSINRLKKILPSKWQSILKDANFTNSISNTIENYRHKFISNDKLNLEPIYGRIFDIVYNKIFFKTYLISVQAHTLENIQNTLKTDIGQTMYIGINFHQLVVLRNYHDKQPIIRIPINQFQCTVTVYSIFINMEGGQKSMRFDGKMFFYFSELVDKYRLINRTFPQWGASLYNV